MTRRPTKRSLRPVIGEHFVDRRTPETIFFEDDTYTETGSAGDIHTPRRRHVEAIMVLDEMDFRHRKIRKH